uniref:WD repeat-containing protein 18 n=1 Tax=Parascaris univalens TaxID=6257 RepID=A0A915AKP4_PARUN
MLSSISAEASPPLELLLIASETADPFATKIVVPSNGVAIWSLKGSELQGSIIGCVEPLGGGGDVEVLLLSCKDKPLIHALTLNPHRRRHVKSVLIGPAESVLTSDDGALLFVTIGTQLFTWMVNTGELLSVVDAHYQRISCLCLSSDGTLLISGSDDGSVNVFHLADLACWDVSSFEKRKPFREWRVHSLSVRAVCSTRCGEQKVISCSLDHTAAIHSIAHDYCLLKISGDQPLTHCAIDPLGRYLYIGTDKGTIAQINLYARGSRREEMIVTRGESADELPMFVGHSATITRLEANHDGKILASGDTQGFYYIWDVFSRQCLVSSQTKGSICRLLFIWNWPSLHNKEYPTSIVPLTVLQRQRTQNGAPKAIVILPQKFRDREMDTHEKLIIDDLNRRIDDIIAEEMLSETSDSDGDKVDKRENRKENTDKHSTDLDTSRDEDMSAVLPIEDDVNVRVLQARIAELENINKQLYNYAASLILDEE